MRRTEGPREKLEKTQKEVEKTKGYSKRRWKQIDVGGTKRRSQTTTCGKTQRDTDRRRDAEGPEEAEKTQRRRRIFKEKIERPTETSRCRETGSDAEATQRDAQRHRDQDSTNCTCSQFPQWRYHANFF